MESFLLVALTAISTAAILKYRQPNRLRKIKFRQSALHLVVKSALPTNKEANMLKKTQSKKFVEDNTIRVIRTPDNKAYWVDKNVFYYLDLSDGEFDPSQAKVVDTSTLSKEEIDELLFILDNLKNGK